MIPASSTMAFLWLLACLTLLGVSLGQGEPARQPELSIMPRIINGKTSRPGAWPWHVVLLSRSGIPLCGGVLINRNWVVTAAHCNFTRTYSIVAGLHDRRTGGDYQRLWIAQVFKHPMYNPSTQYSDIALLKLRLGVHFNSKVSAIRLPRVQEQFLPRSWCKIMGWGFMDVNGTRYPEKLQEATVAIVDNPICKAYFRHISLDAMFCVGRKGVSSAPGDSGGSLACQKNGVWTLAGIMSFSAQINPTNRPFVVTRITAFLSWIEETLAHN